MNAILFSLMFSFLSFTTPDISTNTSTDSYEIQPGKWEHLGTRKVNYKLDKDEFSVTAREGRFRKIRFDVDKGDINFHKCTVIFGDGSKQNVNMRKTIKAGSSTRAIDITGHRRVIKKVVFVYDTKGFKSKKAKVKLYGFH